MLSVAKLSVILLSVVAPRMMLAPDFRLYPFHDGRDGANVGFKLSGDAHQLLQIGPQAGQF
jgi:hypothetical protein